MVLLWRECGMSEKVIVDDAGMLTNIVCKSVSESMMGMWC